MLKRTLLAAVMVMLAPLAELAIPRTPFVEILRLIDGLRPAPSAP